MNNKEFERVVCALSNFGPFAIDERTRALRAAGLLPYGARGPHAPDISADSAAKVLISLASEDPKSAPDLVLKFWSMVQKDGNFLNCPFGEALTTCLAKKEIAHVVRAIRVCRSFPMAVIVREDGSETRFGPEDQPDSGFGFAIWSEFVLSGGFLHQLALDLSEPPETTEWTDEISVWTGGGGKKAAAVAMETVKKDQEDGD